MALFDIIIVFDGAHMESESWKMTGNFSPHQEPTLSIPQQGSPIQCVLKKAHMQNIEDYLLSSNSKRKRKLRALVELNSHVTLFLIPHTKKSRQ